MHAHMPSSALKATATCRNTAYASGFTPIKALLQTKQLEPVRLRLCLRLGTKPSQDAIFGTGAEPIVALYQPCLSRSYFLRYLLRHLLSPFDTMRNCSTLTCYSDRDPAILRSLFSPSRINHISGSLPLHMIAPGDNFSTSYFHSS